VYEGRTTATTVQQRKAANSSQSGSGYLRVAKKTMTNGFKLAVPVANPNATMHNSKGQRWNGFYPKFQ